MTAAPLMEQEIILKIYANNVLLLVWSLTLSFLVIKAKRKVKHSNIMFINYFKNVLLEIFSYFPENKMIINKDRLSDVYLRQFLSS